MLFAFSIAPAGGGSDSVGDVVAEAVRVVRESGLPNETTSMFTTIEAETWDEGMAVVKRAVEAVQARAPRVSLVLKADIRPGHTGSADGQGAAGGGGTRAGVTVARTSGGSTAVRGCGVPVPAARRASVVNRAWTGLVGRPSIRGVIAGARRTSGTNG